MENFKPVAVKSPRNMDKTELQMLLRSKSIDFSIHENKDELRDKLKRAGLGRNEIKLPTAPIDLKSPLITRTYIPSSISIPKADVQELQRQIKSLEEKQNILVDYIRQLKYKGRGAKAVESQRAQKELYEKLLKLGFNL